MYQARILDKNRKLVAILPGVRWHYNRRINEATDISIYIPRETIDEHITPDHALYGFFMPTQPVVVEPAPRRVREDKTKYAEIASYIQIYKGDKLKASGKIVGRTLGQVVTVEAYTEEILLEANLTPAQYGKVWDGWDLADVARDLLDGWQTIRVKAQPQWQDRMVDSSNVDLTTDPGLVMLAKRASGQYYDSGYITLVFNKSEIPHFKSWDRVRWSADSEDPVTTSIQVSTNGVSFSAPFDGGLPEEIGYYIGGDHDQVWVRVNLETTDTTAEDRNGNTVGVSPTVFALEVVARTEGKLVAGNIPSVAGVTVKGLSADYASAFRVLVDACDQVGWEFQVVNGALNIAENLGVDRTKDFVFRAGSNIEITALGDDDGELCNVLTAYSPGRGINRMEITLRDEASIAEFGEYPLAMEFDAEKLSELEQKAQEFLDEHNLPKTQFEVAIDFDHDKEPDYGLGDKVRVADPETGIVTTSRIMTEAREYGESGLVVNLELGKPALNLQSVLDGKHKPTKPLDPFTPTGVYARGVIAGLVVGCAVPKIDWAYTECHLSTASGFTPSSSTLRTSGRQNRFDIMELTPGVRYYAKVVHVDSAGRRSEPSQEVSAVANYMPPELLPDYSLGVEKFMENLKPPIMVTSLPSLPDPRYTIGTSVFLTTDKKLYSTDGNTWEPVGAGTVTADEIVAGIITAGGIKADWYADIRNVLPYVGADSLDQNHPIEVDFYIPSETTNIVRIMLSAKGLRYRAYARTAAAGGSHTHSVTVPGHTHALTVSTRTYNSAVTKSGGAHTHGIGGVTGSTQTIASLTLSQDGAHSHSLGASGLGLPTSSDAHSHTASASSAGGHTHTLAISEYKHTHKVSGNVSSVNNHTHGISVTTGSHSHGHSGSISSSGSHAHILEIDSATHYHTVSGTTTSSHTHDHTGKTRTIGYHDVGNHTHNFTTDSASHSHTVSGNTAASGGHTHSVDLTTAQDAHRHTGSSIGEVSDHEHTITVGSYTHYHNVTGITTTSATHGGHVTDVNYAGHTHTIPISEPHTHEFAYVDTEVGSVTETTSITVDTTSVSETHTHNLIYNIALDTTPANVRLYCDNGSGYDAGQNLASAPGSDEQEYVLATELDLTNRFSGTGWKRIKFTSSRRGRIVWQLITKLDLTA